MASTPFIQNGDLVGMLERDFQIELIEREMSSNCIILDSNTVILLWPISQLPIVPLSKKQSHEKIEFLKNSALGTFLIRLTPHFSSIILLLEGVNGQESELSTFSFTTPVLKSLASLDLFARLVMNLLDSNLDILFSSCLLETACLIR
jgi:hypothetical protein